jgi:hypothetical protein
MPKIPRFVLLLFFITVVVQDAGAFGIDYNRKKKKDSLNTENIIDLSHKLGIHFYGKKKLTTFGFKDNISKRELLYRPNDQLNIGFGFNYKFIGIGLAFNFKFINNDDLIYGNTSRLDWNMNAYGRKSVIDLTFFYYKSFYLYNPQNVLNGWQQGDSNYIRPDVEMASVGLAYTYIFNHEKFSYKAAFVSNAIQKRSAGSFFLGGFINVSSVEADSSFFPSNSVFDTFPQLYAFGRGSVGISFGYAYNLIIKKYFYISSSLSLQPSLGSLSYRIVNRPEDSKNAPSVNVVPRFAIGHNSPKWYYGLSMVSRATIINAMNNSNRLSLIFQYGNYRFFIGRHFDVKRKKKK